MSIGAGSARKRKKWAQAANERMEEKGTKGKFTEKAHAAGYSSPLEYAQHVMAAPEGKFSGETRKEANFARNVNK